MLADDAGLTLWSHVSERSTKGDANMLSLRLEPPDKGLARFASQIVRDQYSQGVEAAIPGFLKMMATTIVAEGKFVYELSIGRNVDSKQIEGFDFRPVCVPGGRVFRLGSRVIQVLPSNVAKECGGGRFRMLEPADTFVFTAPRKWHKRLRLVRRACSIHDHLEQLSRSQFLASLDNGSPGVDFMGERNSQVKMLARAIAPIGWHGRGTFGEFTTEYQQLEWAIRWDEFCTDLRDELLREVQRAVSRIAQIIGSQSRLVFRESGNRKRSEELRQLLRSGQASCSEVLDAVL
jgi:hypothetical protein